jgi:hypothetical protein
MQCSLATSFCSDFTLPLNRINQSLPMVTTPPRIVYIPTGIAQQAVHCLWAKNEKGVHTLETGCFIDTLYGGIENWLHTLANYPETHQGLKLPDLFEVGKLSALTPIHQRYFETPLAQPKTPYEVFCHETLWNSQGEGLQLGLTPRDKPTNLPTYALHCMMPSTGEDPAKAGFQPLLLQFGTLKTEPVFAVERHRALEETLVKGIEATVLKIGHLQQRRIAY